MAQKGKMKDRENIIQERTKLGGNIPPGRSKLGGNIPPTRETFGKLKVDPIKEIEEEPVTDLQTDEEKMLEMSVDLGNMRRDQHKMIAKQQKQYGTTVDIINNLQAEIDKAKSQNNALITEMKSEKERYENLHSNLEELHIKFETYQNTLKSLKREKDVWVESRTLLIENDDRSKRLTKSNRHLRALLLKHHINPDVDASIMGNSIHVRKPQTERKPINAVSPRSGFSGSRVLHGNVVQGAPMVFRN